MSENDEIRAWGLENGWPDLKERGRLPAALRSAWASHVSGGPADPEPASEGPEERDGTVFFRIPEPPPEREDAVNDSFTPGPGTGAEQEKPPEQPKGGMREKLRERIEAARSRPRPSKRRRVSLETLGSLAWGGAARLAASARGGAYVPVAKMMAFQSPVAGMVIEDAARNTAADAALQPVARLVASGSAAGTLVGGPFLAAVTCARPDLYPVTRPLMVSVMKEWVIVAGPKLRELKRREEKFADEMREFGSEFGISAEDMVDEMFAGWFQDIPQAAGTAAANGHAAG